LSVILTSPTEFATFVDLMAKRATNDKIRSAAALALRTARLDGRYQIRIREDDDIDETGNPVLDTMAQFAGRDMTEAALGVVGK
jgi:pyridoxine/pyridoxamine 5'-phosphate oxidase